MYRQSSRLINWDMFRVRAFTVSKSVCRVMGKEIRTALWTQVRQLAVYFALLTSLIINYVQIAVTLHRLFISKRIPGLFISRVWLNEHGYLKKSTRSIQTHQHAHHSDTLATYSCHLAFFRQAQRARRVQRMLFREVSHTFQMKINDRGTSAPQAVRGRKRSSSLHYWPRSPHVQGWEEKETPLSRVRTIKNQAETPCERQDLGL